VDDLSDALILAVERAGELSGMVLDLGAPEPVTLGDFLSELSLVLRGRRLPRVPIPLMPIELAVGLAEGLGLNLPVSGSNLKGMKSGAPIDTRAGMAALGVPVRPLGELLRMAGPAGEAGPAVEAGPAAENRAMRILLVGAGKMGIIHCGSLARARGAVLCGMADPRAGAIGMLRGIGARAPGYADLDAALAGTSPDAAVIATPPHLHLPLALKLAGRGLPCLVEKPLAPDRAALGGYRAMPPADRGRLVPGYVMLRNPHVRAWLGRLKSGELGRPSRFAAFSLLSLADSGPVRGWMAVPGVSGGGALMNLGVHALSVVHAAFGKPRTVAARFSGKGKGVDDSLVADLDYGEARGRFWTSWAIRGFPRAEQSIYVWTDRGLLCLNGMAGWFLDGSGRIECVHQLDGREAYNMAPDFSGAGFAAEVAGLARLAREGGGTEGMASALEFEEMVADVYGGAVESSRFEGGAGGDSAGLAPPPGTAGPGCVVDGRELGRGPSPSVDSGLMAWPGQFPEIERGDGSRDTVIVFPDFMSQSRMLAGGRAFALLRSMGMNGVMGAGLAAIPRAVAERGATFWVAAEGLATASLAGIPRGFRGTLLLNGYLTDLATTFERRDFIARVLARARRRCPGARVGFHTAIPREAGRTLVEAGPVHCLCILSSPSAASAADFAMVAGQAGPGVEIISDPGPMAPPVAARMGAVAEGLRHGARRLILPSLAHPLTAELRAGVLSAAWKSAFPGAGLPEVLVGR
jgi:predicted dehydrogenase